LPTFGERMFLISFKQRETSYVAQIIRAGPSCDGGRPADRRRRDTGWLSQLRWENRMGIHINRSVFYRKPLPLDD
jgi:hypothetical protein